MRNSRPSVIRMSTAILTVLFIPLSLQSQAIQPSCHILSGSVHAAAVHMETLQNRGAGGAGGEVVQAPAKAAAPAGAEGDEGLALPVVGLQEGVDEHGGIAPPV